MSYLIIFLLFSLAGFSKAISDRISWSDLFSHIPFLSRNFTGIKDKNKDGKVSFIETYFPFDGWHLAEWIRLIPLAAASGFCLAIKEPIIHIFWIDFISITLFLIVIYNFIFIAFYNLLPRLK